MTTRAHLHDLAVIAVFKVGGCLILMCAGCTFSPSVTVPPKALKGAATELSTGAKEAGKEVGKEAGKEIQSGLTQASRQAMEHYGDEIRAVSQDLHVAAQAVRDSADAIKGSPAAFGRTVVQQLVKDQTVQAALKEVSAFARTQERLTEAGVEVPKILAAKITELQRDLGSKEGVLSQQRAAIMEDLSRERQATIEALRRERIELFKDLDALAVKVVDHAGAQIRNTVETALGLLIVLGLVVLGVPFAAGFLAGRHSRKSS